MRDNSESIRSESDDQIRSFLCSTYFSQRVEIDYRSRCFPASKPCWSFLLARSHSLLSRILPTVRDHVFLSPTTIRGRDDCDEDQISLSCPGCRIRSSAAVCHWHSIDCCFRSSAFTDNITGSSSMVHCIAQRRSTAA